MSNSIAKLAGIGGEPLCGAPGAIEGLEECGLMSLLRLKNGFYAFEGALHVLPYGPAQNELGLKEWNSSAGWRSDYQGLADDCFFFAEDVFGGQFCVHDGVVMSFDPETGDKCIIAADVEEWAHKILSEYEVLTGHPLAHEWQVRHGAIPHGQRLIPKIPFVLGGNFEVENLFLIEAARGMRSRANLAVQIKDLPEGSNVEFKVVD
jgi:hypothetical protein